MNLCPTEGMQEPSENLLCNFCPWDCTFGLSVVTALRVFSRNQPRRKQAETHVEGPAGVRRLGAATKIERESESGSNSLSGRSCQRYAHNRRQSDIGQCRLGCDQNVE